MTTYKDDTALAVGHRLALEDRNKLSLTGITDMGSFDESAAVMETARGTLIVRGENLHVEKLSLDAGEVTLSGEVGSLVYEESAKSQGGFLQRLFR